MQETPVWVLFLSSLCFTSYGTRYQPFNHLFLVLDAFMSRHTLSRTFTTSRSPRFAGSHTPSFGEVEATRYLVR